MRKIEIEIPDGFEFDKNSMSIKPIEHYIGNAELGRTIIFYYEGSDNKLINLPQIGVIPKDRSSWHNKNCVQLCSVHGYVQFDHIRKWDYLDNVFPKYDYEKAI